jgi:hypothetical protein
MGTIRDHPEVSMSTPATTLESLRRLEMLYSQGYQSEVVDQALRDVVAQELHELRREASLITADIAEMERKYQMKSADFQERFNSGTLGDDADFFQWSALNGMAQSLARRLQVLEYGP